MRKQSPMYSCWATIVITRNADCNKQTYQPCAKKQKMFMREKFAEKNSWRWLQECRLQHKHTNHVQKKSYVPLMREKTLAEEKLSQHCVKGNQSCAEESCAHPPICLLNPKSHASPRWVVGAPHLTSPLVWRNHLCQITQRYQKETKASSITERQKFYCTCCYPISYVQCCWSRSPG
jgi:hypothetical protein